MSGFEADAYGVEVSYREAEPKTITITGRYPDDEYSRTDEYTFRMDGGTAVLTGIDADGVYSVQAAEPARDAVRDAVAALPFVQAVAMFPEVDA